jgi:hypothetical protein
MPAFLVRTNGHIVSAKRIPNFTFSQITNENSKGFFVASVPITNVHGTKDPSQCSIKFEISLNNLHIGVPL